jgi:TonB family protein
MRLSMASSALAAAFFLTPVAAGYAPALSQDFSITNPEERAIPAHPDLMRELQAWWEAHAYYPRHAANNDESGTVKVHLVVLPDGRVFPSLVGRSGSQSIDAAAEAVFHGASVRPFTGGEPTFDMDISLHYVLAYRHDQPVPAGYTPVASRGPFTITNDPIKSPILGAMLQRTCTGTMVYGGIADHPLFGVHSWAQAIFFQKPNGTPWVKLYEFGHSTLAPVTQIGKMVTWTGRQGNATSPFKSGTDWFQYTLWSDGDNHIKGSVGARRLNTSGVAYNANVAGYYLDLTCAPEVSPTVTWNDLFTEQNTSLVTSPVDISSVDPP